MYRYTPIQECCVSYLNLLFFQADRPDEMERVEAAGGRVINWEGYRVLGVLATSRSIGLFRASHVFVELKFMEIITSL